MSRSKQGSSSIKLKPVGLWSEVLSERVRLTIKTSNTMKVNSLAMKLNPEVERATIVQHTRTAVYINYLRDTGGKRRQRESACLGVLLPFSHQQVAIDVILDPGTEVTLSVKGPHQVTVFGQFPPADNTQSDSAASETIFTRSLLNDPESGPSIEQGKSSAPAGPSGYGTRRSLSRAPSTASVDQTVGDRTFSPAMSGRRQSVDSTSSFSYYDAHDDYNNRQARGSVGPADKKVRRS